jgi:hypothetical protein
MAISPKKGIARLLSFLSVAALLHQHRRGKFVGTGNPSGEGRFNLSRLPPAWKGKVQRRKNRGGKKA